MARAVEPLLHDPDGSVQERAVRALKTWGDAKSEAPLAARVADKNFAPWREATAALARIAPPARATRALLARLGDDAGAVTQALAGQGPGTEAVILDVYRAEPDPRVRGRLIQLLGSLGTEASLPALKEAAGKIGDGVLAAIAEETLKDVSARQ